MDGADRLDRGLDQNRCSPMESNARNATAPATPLSMDRSSRWPVRHSPSRSSCHDEEDDHDEENRKQGKSSVLCLVCVFVN